MMVNKERAEQIAIVAILWVSSVYVGAHMLAAILRVR
jgi:hypothetical protein